ncbi:MULTISPECIES: hypothetical protein [Olivibacter]|uniref:HTTM-like domain-containing protein n=1 Tax=Olivibacter jilunii TaxID=985016 RepID=A0ABW6B865_9SPHI
MIFSSFKKLPLRQLDFQFPLRVGTAGLAGLAYYTLGDDFKLFYTFDGLVDYTLLDIKKDTLLPGIQAIEKAIDSKHFYQGLSFTYYSLAGLLAIGFATPLVACILLLLHACIFTAVPLFSYGFDYFCQIGLFYCLLFPTYRSYSVDKYLWKLIPASTPTLYRCQRILQIHLSIVYFFNGLNKAFGSSWWNGQALWKALHLPYFNSAQWDVGFLPHWLLSAGGILVLLLEIAYPLNLLLRRLQEPFIGSIIILHLLISIFLGLSLFSLAMILLNYCAWFHQTRKHINPNYQLPKVCRE